MQEFDYLIKVVDRIEGKVDVLIKSNERHSVKIKLLWKVFIVTPFIFTLLFIVEKFIP